MSCCYTGKYRFNYTILDAPYIVNIYFVFFYNYGSRVISYPETSVILGVIQLMSFNCVIKPKLIVVVRYWSRRSIEEITDIFNNLKSIFNQS